MVCPLSICTSPKNTPARTHFLTPSFYLDRRQKRKAARARRARRFQTHLMSIARYVSRGHSSHIYFSLFFLSFSVFFSFSFFFLSLFFFLFFSPRSFLSFSFYPSLPLSRWFSFLFDLHASLLFLSLSQALMCSLIFVTPPVPFIFLLYPLLQASPDVYPLTLLQKWLLQHPDPHAATVVRAVRLATVVDPRILQEVGRWESSGMEGRWEEMEIRQGKKKEIKLQRE